MRIILISTLLGMLAINLSACGKKGPLYLPEENKQTQESSSNLGLK